MEHKEPGAGATGRGEVQHPVDQVRGGKVVGFFQRTARVFRLYGEIPQVSGGLHQGTARKGAARPAGGEHQLPAHGFCIQVAGAVHQHAAHAAVQTAGVGAQVCQQVVVPVVHAAFVQRDGEQDGPVLQGLRDRGHHPGGMTPQGVFQRQGIPL